MALGTAVTTTVSARKSTRTSSVINAASCLRLSRALAAEMHENWIEATRYLNMDLLREQQKERPRLGVAA